MPKKINVAVYLDLKLADYGFGPDHPFSNYRMFAFESEFRGQGLEKFVEIRKAVMASQEQIESFHTHDYVEEIKERSVLGQGFLDLGDTPAYKGMFETSSYVVGSVLDAAEQLMVGHIMRAFIPIAGLHHAMPNAASGFCIFNDCGVLINTLREKYQIKRVAYVDIDVHHGDGVFYAFEDDTDLIFADIHQAGIFPGTGWDSEIGKGKAAGSKLNIPIPEGSGDQEFLDIWPKVKDFLHQQKPEFIILQCGADSLAGDPLAGLMYTAKTHIMAAESLCELANKYAHGRLLAVGGGGYNLSNIAKAWTGVVKALIETES